MKDKLRLMGYRRASTTGQSDRYYLPGQETDFRACSHGRRALPGPYRDGRHQLAVPAEGDLAGQFTRNVPLPRRRRGLSRLVGGRKLVRQPAR
jgi:hypothetical protein